MPANPPDRRRFFSLRKTWGRMRRSDPPMIQPYRGYASRERLFLKGRVLEDEGISHARSGVLRNLVNTFKRFESDEIPGAKVGIRLGENYFETTTDKEGYFTIDTAWQPPEKMETPWLEASVELLDAPGREIPAIATRADILYPAHRPAFGIISDIDDTVLRTHVTSRLFLKMLYVTFFQNAHQRLPMEGMVELLQAFTGAGDGPPNPVFYVSDSPWNIYDLLTQFMQLRQLPKGPVMLRDYGLFPVSRPKDYRGHKLYTIGHILKTFPDLRFIMLGDTAGKDTDIYLTLAAEFPGRIDTIYIRHTRNTANARRAARLINESTDVNAVLIKKSGEIWEHARGKGVLAG